jgi:DNA-binding Lrp family transcriptional regulator
MKLPGTSIPQTLYAGSKMDNKDRKILELISERFPLDTHPLRTIAEELDIDENDLLQRMNHLKSDGIIRRIGATIVPRRLGWFSTLCAADVPRHIVDKFSRTANSYKEITHNYERTGTPNCWFTIIAPDRNEALKIISEIENACGIKIIELPARRIFKIGVKFSL